MLGSAFFEYLEVQILKIYPTDANHGGTFCGFIVCTHLPKKLWKGHWLEEGS